ncbi:MAG: dihydroorotase [Chloroflexi bacterium CG07_land_8_20_14_0_80_51_10]|nr:MAG: dihydroorotase [Chloroflexi bacterium CG07_land_8_20_14_0_80_51_10]
MNLLIQNGRIIDPSQKIDRIADLLIVDGKVAQISTVGAGLKPAPTVLDATDMIVCPGFIDLHCHLRQPGFEEKETIASGTMAAARGGYTTVCCMPNTDPPIDTSKGVEQVKRIANKKGVVRVLPIGCVTEGRSGGKLVDMSALSRAGAVAFSDDGSPVWDSEIMRQALEQSKTLGLLIIDHCEDLTLAEHGVINAGMVAAKLGYKGIPVAAEERMVARDIELAKQTRGRLHIAHVSTAGSVELIRQAKKQGINVTAEVTPHHLTLTEEAVITCGTNAKVNPPLRTEEDISALIDGLREGVLDAIATDHAPHTKADKAQSFDRAAFGISGFETALGSLMSLVHRDKIGLPALISKLTREPAQIIRSSELLGSLKVGLLADITIFDPNAEWTVEPGDFASKGKNTPLAGTLLKGKVMATIVTGKIAYRDEIVPRGQGSGPSVSPISQ